MVARLPPIWQLPSEPRLKGKKRSPTDLESSNQGFVWVQGDDGNVRYIHVHTGLSDSVNTEIVSVIASETLEPVLARLRSAYHRNDLVLRWLAAPRNTSGAGECEYSSRK